MATLAATFPTRQVMQTSSQEVLSQQVLQNSHKQLPAHSRIIHLERHAGSQKRLSLAIFSPPSKNLRRRGGAPIRSSLQPPKGEDATETSTSQTPSSPSSSTLQESASSPISGSSMKQEVPPTGPPVLTIVAGALVLVVGLWAVISTIKGLFGALTWATGPASMVK